MSAMKIVIVLCLLAFIVLIIVFSTQSPASTDNGVPKELSYQIHGDPIVDFTPVVEVKKSTKMTVSFYFTNTSAKPIGYWTPWVHAGPGIAWNWNLFDCKTGKVLTRPNTNIALKKESVSTIQPGDSVLVRISLAHEFVDIHPGLYELRTKCSVDQRGPLYDIGVTAMQFEQTIMLINVVE